MDNETKCNLLKKTNKELLVTLEAIVDAHENLFCDDEDEIIPGWFIHAEQVIKEAKAAIASIQG